MPYWQLYYHIVWATKNRQPFVTPDVENLIYGLIREKVVGLGGTFFAVNGMAEHVHLVASIPPKIAVSTFVGQVKGVTSTRFNKLGNNTSSLFWQIEYAVFSFDAKRLPNVIAYVENQKRHHAEGSIIPILERLDDQGVKTIHEVNSAYDAYNPDWWREVWPPASQASDVE